MREKLHPVSDCSAWSMKDCYRCVHCLEFICIEDSFCRGCGDEICNTEKQLMRANLRELAKNNLPSLVLCMGFVLIIIAGLILANA